jgi:hypothetical protein
LLFNLLRHRVDDRATALIRVLGQHIDHLRPYLLFELNPQHHGSIL